MNKKNLFSEFGLIILAVAAIVVIGIINFTFRGVRIDLTEDNLYTVSDGTTNILKSLEKPVTVQLFYSDKATEEIPYIRNYAKRVIELLQEYEIKAGGKIKFEIIEPEPFSEAEDKASEYGLHAMRLSMGSDSIYLGLVAFRENGKKETIPALQQEREEFLEYDISELIYKAGKAKGAKLGIISTLDVAGGFDPATRQPKPPWTSTSQLNKITEVEYLGLEVENIGDDIGALLVIHPKELSDKTLYAIDQFVVHGGNVLVFVDPMSEMEGNQAGMPVNVGGPSDLKKLFDVWGLRLVENKIVGDSKHALMVNAGGVRPMRHLGLQGFGKTNFVGNDVVINNLENLNWATAGALESLTDAKTEFIPLVQSSDQAMLMDSEKFQYVHNPETLFQGFTPSGERYTVMARVTGVISSAFPDGLKEEEKKAESSENEDEKSKKPHLAQSEASVNIIVVSDTDVLSDRLWVRVRNFFGQRIPSPFADNGALLTNAVDNLFGNADLISIRSRGRYSRPFNKVDELRLEAEANFRRKEEELQSRLRETEAKLAELQTKKEGEDVLTLSPEQEQEVRIFQQQKLKIRKDLREVRHQLGKNIENLGGLLKFLNITLMPIILTVLVLILRFYRRRPA